MGPRFTKAIIPLLFTISALMLSGCQGPRSLETRYYLLTAQAPDLEVPRRDTVIGVGPVRVAPFLDRTQIVTHAGSGATDMSDGQRWAEPLDSGIQRVVVQNLAALTGADMRNFPWTRTTAPEYAVRIDILDLNHTPDGNAVLEANWILEDKKEKQLLYSRKETYKTSVKGAENDNAAVTSAYSELINQLSLSIAAQIPPRGE